MIRTYHAPHDATIISGFVNFLDLMNFMKIKDDQIASQQLINFATGFIAPPNLNIDQAFEIGEKDHL